MTVVPTTTDIFEVIMKTLLRLLPAALMFATSVVLSSTQNSTINKPFSQWTKQDAETILNNSAWAVTQEVRIKYAGQTRSVAGGGPQPLPGTGNLNEQNSISSAGAEAPVDFQFKVRLRSALQVREALVRLKQIEAKYDKMSEKDRATFDDKTRGLLDCPACKDNYVVTLSSKSTQNPGADAVFTLFKGGRLEDLQRFIYIGDEGGERRPPIHFVPPKLPGDEAIFFFPRLNDKGAALLTPTSEELIVNFTNNEINIIANFRIDVSKLIVNGKVDF